MLDAWLISKSVVDVALWIGTAGIVGAYAYNSWVVPTKKRPLLFYQGINLIGTLLYIYGMSVLGIWQSLILNIVWGIICIIAIVKILRGSQ